MALEGLCAQTRPWGEGSNIPRLVRNLEGRLARTVGRRRERMSQVPREGLPDEGDAARAQAPKQRRRAPQTDGGEQVLELVARPPIPRPVAGNWRRLFDSESPSELVERLADGDPLGLWPRAAELVARRRFVVQLDRLFEAVVARAAIVAPLYRGRPAIETWLEARIGDALRSVLAKDAAAEIERRPVDPADHWHHAMMVEVFGVASPLARRAAVVFNAFGQRRRALLFALTFEGRSVDQVVAAGMGTADEVEAHLAAGLGSLSRLEPPSLKDLLSLEGEL